jgi:restriction system protein
VVVVAKKTFQRPSRGPWDDRLMDRIATHPTRAGLLAMLVPGAAAAAITAALHRPLAEITPWTFAAILFGAMLLIAGVHMRQRGRNLMAEAKQVEDLRALTWRGFEELVRAGYRGQGWTVHQTQGGADGGADMILVRGRRRYLVQCKQWRERSVGVDKVRELLGVVAASKAAGGIFVTCGEFTEEAERFGENNGIQLVNGVALLRLVVVAAPDAEPPPALPTEGPPCTRCGGPTHLVAKSLAASSYFGCDRYPECWCRIPVMASGETVRVTR